MLPLVQRSLVDECEQNLLNRLVQQAEMLVQHVQLGHLSSKCVSVAVRYFCHDAFVQESVDASLQCWAHVQIM